MQQPCLLLVAADDVWADTVTRFFTPRGYTVVRARTAAAALEEGAYPRPDAVLIEREMPDLAGVELCRAIRGAPAIDVATPIVMTTVYDLSGDQRLELLRAGAWDVVRSPADPDELVTRVDNYLNAKREAQRARDVGLVDPATGLYNDHGLARRCEEAVAEAFRRHAALACLAVAPELPREAPRGRLRPEAIVFDIARALQGVRRSDVTGRQASAEFVIVAPRTDVVGAVGLARRLTGSVRPLLLRVGYDAVPNVREIPTTPAALLRSALEALHRIPAGSERTPIQPFRPFEHRRPDLI